LINDHIAYGK